MSRHVLSEIVEILLELGVQESETSPDCHLRSDLSLDSTETTKLELELTRRFNTKVDLWDQRDYTLMELAQRISEDGAAR